MVIVMYSRFGVKEVYVCGDSDVDVVVYKCYMRWWWWQRRVYIVMDSNGGETWTSTKWHNI